MQGPENPAQSFRSIKMYLQELKVKAVNELN